MVSWDLAGFTVPNFVDSNDSELVLNVFHQASYHKFGCLEFFWNIALGPVLSINSLALNKVSNDLTATIIGRFGPAKANGALGRVHYLGECRWARRIWKKNYTNCTTEETERTCI